VKGKITREREREREKFSRRAEIITELELAN
jgi:hypothetical protein